MNRFFNALTGVYRPVSVNNRKETKGRLTRKQRVPLYTTDPEKREKLIAQWQTEGVSSYEIERRLRQERLILHETA